MRRSTFSNLWRRFACSENRNHKMFEQRQLMFCVRAMRLRTLFTPFRWLALAVCAIACSVESPVCQAQNVSPQQYVKPIDWSRFDHIQGVPSGDAFAQKLAGLLQRQANYTQAEIASDYLIANDYPNFSGTQFYYAFTGGFNREQSIRPLSSFAYGTAVMLKTGIYDPSVTGQSADQALNQAILAINGVAFSYKINSPDNANWGGSRDSGSSTWQAALWASQAAEAAWMLWDDLPNDTRRAVATMVEYEANTFKSPLQEYSVPYWKTPAGVTNYSGDTKAEENAWNARFLGLAQAMMPDHPNVALWRDKASELNVSAYSRQADLSNTTLVDGKPVNQWLGGYNAFNNGVVVNHGAVQPDYMAADSILRGTAAINTTLAGQFIPESALWNADMVYDALASVVLVTGPDNTYETGEPIVGAGGTMFRRLPNGEYSANVYYPGGQDWASVNSSSISSVVLDSYLNFDLLANYYGWDDGKNYDASGWANARVDRMLAMMDRPHDGIDGALFRTGDGKIINYHGYEEGMFESNAQAWMLYWLMSHDLVSPIGPQWGMMVPEPHGILLSALTATMTLSVYFSRKR